MSGLANRPPFYSETVRVLLIVLLFVIWESSAGAPPPWVAPVSGTLVMAIGYCLLIAVMAVWSRHVARRGAANYNALGRRVDRFNLGMGGARGLIPVWFAVAVFGLGWRAGVDELLRATLGRVAVLRLVTPGVVVGVLPGFVAWAGLWWAQYPVDKAVREQGVLVQLEADLPVFAPPPFASYFENKLRVQLLFTVVPVLMILCLRDAAAVAWRATTAAWPSESVDSAVSLAAVAGVLLVVPVVLRHVLSTRRLPDGRLRDRLSTVLALAGVRCREVLLWHTHNNLANAAVMGLLPPVRYVMMSDLLLETMTDEQVQAVFAHELGHVHHRHLAWFAGTLGTAMAALSVSGDWLSDRFAPAGGAGSLAAQGGTLAVAGAVIWVGYGVLSRWFERQADVYAVRLMDRAAGGGTAAFTGALERVAVVNNIPFRARNWTHGSMAARVSYLERFAADPAVADRFDRRGTRVRVGLCVLMIACGAVAALGLRYGYSPTG